MTIPENVEPRKQGLFSWISVIGILVVLYLVIHLAGGIKTADSTNSSGSGVSGASSSTSNWVPSKFFQWNSDIAYKWVDNPSCAADSNCTAIQIITNKDCPNNLYAELVLKDKNGVQYDYTNDSQGSLVKGTTAELTFNIPVDPRFDGFDISKISCL